MRYTLPPDKILVAKAQVTLLKGKIKKLKEELCKAVGDKKTTPIKYYAGINKRIDYFKTEIEAKEKKLKDFQDAVKNGYIE